MQTFHYRTDDYRIFGLADWVEWTQRETTLQTNRNCSSLRRQTFSAGKKDWCLFTSRTSTVTSIIPFYTITHRISLYKWLISRGVCIQKISRVLSGSGIGIWNDVVFNAGCDWWRDCTTAQFWKNFISVFDTAFSFLSRFGLDTDYDRNSSSATWVQTRKQKWRQFKYLRELAQCLLRDCDSCYWVNEMLSMRTRTEQLYYEGKLSAKGDKTNV